METSAKETIMSESETMTPRARMRTAMEMKVPDRFEREDVIAYLQGVAKE